MYNVITLVAFSPGSMLAVRSMSHAYISNQSSHKSGFEGENPVVLGCADSKSMTGKAILEIRL